MSNEDRKTARRKEFIPRIAQTFAELGYRKATTKELAESCQVSETILYRLWDDKKAMFVDSIDYLYEKRMEQWNAVSSNAASAESRVDQLIKETSESYGQNKLRRIIFVALTETNDDKVKQALKRMYFDFHKRIQDELTIYREQIGDENLLPVAETAWAMVGWGAFMNIVEELELLGAGRKGEKKIQDLFLRVARVMLDLKAS